VQQRRVLAHSAETIARRNVSRGHAASNNPLTHQLTHYGADTGRHDGRSWTRRNENAEGNERCGLRRTRIVGLLICGFSVRFRGGSPHSPDFIRRFAISAILGANLSRSRNARLIPF
jgi:hypothetical protein